MKNFGSFIRYERKSKGLTQEEIADSLNIVTPVLSKWENDRGVPALAYICKLCRIFGISIEDCISCERTEFTSLPPEEYNAIELGNTIKNLRIKNGWSQEEVGKKLFVTSQTVSKWENGGVSSLDVLQKLSETYEISPTLLLNRLQESATDKAMPQPIKSKRKSKAVIVVIISLFVAVAIVLGGWGISVAVRNSLGQVPDEIGYGLPLQNAECYRKYGEFYFSNSLTGSKWMVHEGVDFFAESGEKVYAVADGSVESFDDKLSGITISHNDGSKSKYYCVTSVSGLNVGDKVKKGGVIATVKSDSLGFEYNELPHLHFELYNENGERIDPSTKIKFDSN